MRRFLLVSSFLAMIASGSVVAQNGTMPLSEACPENAAQTSFAMLNTARKIDMTLEQIAALSQKLEGLGEACRANPFVQLHVAEASYALARHASPTDIVKRAGQSYNAILAYDAQLNIMSSLIANPEARIVFNQQRSRETQIIAVLYQIFIGPVLFDLARQGVVYEGFAFDPADGCPYTTNALVRAELAGHTAAINDWLLRSDSAIALSDLPVSDRLSDLSIACAANREAVAMVLAEAYLNMARRAAKYPGATRAGGGEVPSDLAAQLAQKASGALDMYETALSVPDQTDTGIAAAISAMRLEISGLTQLSEQ